MTSAAPLLAVTLPARGVREAEEQIDLAGRAGADFAEVRFDRWPRDEVGRAAELFPSSLPLIATLRSADEGGEGPNDPEERRTVLNHLAALPFALVDFEIARDVGRFEGAPGPNLGVEPARRIYSKHWTDPSGVDEWDEPVRSPPLGSRFVKLAAPASLRSFWDKVLPAVLRDSDPRLVILTTGAAGSMARAIAVRRGIPLMFAGPATGTGPESTPVEGSQIPVDRLVQLRSHDGPGRLFAVLGRPISRSLSPAIHHRWFRELGHPALYVAVEAATEEEFVDTVPRLAEHGFHGLNVTAPLKRAAREVATSESAAVEASGCANTLSLSGGEIAAENTDLAAILRRFRELRDSQTWDGAQLTVLGSGGAARATLAAARALGCRAAIVARDERRSRALAEEFGAESQSLPAPQPSPLVVNATPVGTDGAESFDLPIASLVGAGTHLVDWVYRPTDPVFSRLAGERGASYEDGWRLFVYQAAESFATWWDDAPSPESVANLVRGGPCAA